MLATAWLGRCSWGLLKGASRPLRGSGARPLASRSRATGGLSSRRGFCLALGPPPLSGLAPPSSSSSSSCPSPGARRLLLLLRAPSPAPLSPERLASGSPRPGLVSARRRPLPAGGESPQPRRRSDGEAGPPGDAARRGRGAASGYPELYENPWTIPNILSLARIGLAPVLGYLIVEENFNIALGVFALAGITDLLDGFIARNWASQKSALGSALDPLADKILISVLYVSLTWASLIPVPLTTLIILRDIVLIAAVFYVRYKTLSPPRTLSRYFNPCYATAQLKPTFISKMNTVVQLILVAASLAAPVFDYVDSIYLQTLWCITAFTTATSAYSYYHYGRKTVQVINNK
ncbi:LOW QUALITY PROTEIN: cardiolipin synthase (CMP-forming) [Dermochelys coriacea]|uniref:LOW QUALITY PROTEIN: cardiolipin synthase (CMP-forming) n=1 Tax=Dermochelys coriacea TaxID=27794 RepID=UPI0018E8F5FE|nr:LOW QUALITY PROTEIN: cardiolipin synthase (CMP-forming) [Dermochelys coriacea]